MDNDYAFPSSQFADFNRRTFFGIVLIAVVSALVTVIVGRLLNQFIVAPGLCGSAGAATCNNSLSVSFHISSLIAAVGSVAMLVNLSVYRPLLVVIALMIGTWGMYNLPFPLVESPWFWQLGMVFFVNTCALLAFAWILRAYNTVLGFILTLLITAAMVAAIVL